MVNNHSIEVRPFQLVTRVHSMLISLAGIMLPPLRFTLACLLAIHLVGSYRIRRGKPTLPESWKTDPFCSNFTIKLAHPGTFTTKPLAAFMRSGSNWLCGLIEAATGNRLGVIGPGGSIWVYSDIVRKKTKINSATSGEFSIIKTHFNGLDGMKNRKSLVLETHEAFKDLGGILLVRNPWDVLLSWNQLVGGRMKVLPVESPLIPGMEKTLLRVAVRWVGLIRTWISESKPEELLILQYEELKANKREELTRILNFLHLDVNEERLDCIVQHDITAWLRPPFSTEASKHIGEAFSKMTKLNAFLNESLVEINELLKPRQIYLDYRGISHPKRNPSLQRMEEL